MGASRITAIAMAIGAGMVLPAACLFPDYTFDRNAGGGGSGSSSTSSTSSTTSSTSTSSSSSSTTSSSGTGGSTSSSTSSSGTPCASADCSDPMCADSYACVPAMPSGWDGYFELYDGPAAGDPGCGGLYKDQAFIGNAGFTASSATCSTCTCGNPQNQTCTLPATIGVGDATCGNAPNCGADMPTDWNAPCTTTAASPYLMGGSVTCGSTANSTCSTNTGAPCNVQLSLGTTTVTGGTCTPSTVMATKPAPTWQSVGEACGGAPAGTGCSGSQVCMPKPSGGFVPKVCVKHAGNMGCPAGQFSEQHVFYTGFTDSRGCTSCSCGAPSGSTCSAKVDVYSTYNACTGAPIGTLNIDTTNGGCVDISGNPQVAGRKATITPPTGGSCTATGGQPTGSAAEDESTATTFCCIP